MNIDQLALLSFERRVQLHTILSEAIERVLNKVEGDNDGQKINRIEKALTRELVLEHNKVATRANKRALKTFDNNSEATFTESDRDKVIRALDRGFKGLANKTESRIAKDIEEIYKTAKVRFAKQNSVVAKNIRKADELAQGVNFGIVDEESIAQLSKLSTTSIGDHYPNNLKPRVINSIQKGVFDKGLNKAQAGEFLKKELTRINGGNAFASVPRSIQAQGLNSVNAYYEGLSATNVTVARNFANIEHMDEAGVTRIQFTAIIDNRTSEICQQMDGRIFTIEQAKDFRQQYLDAENVEQVKGFATWHKSLESIPGNNSGTDISSQDLAQAGVIVPPLHFRCRSELTLA